MAKDSPCPAHELPFIVTPALPCNAFRHVSSQEPEITVRGLRKAKKKGGERLRKRVLTAVSVVAFVLTLVGPVVAQGFNLRDQQIAAALARGRSGNFKDGVMSCDPDRQTCSGQWQEFEGNIYSAVVTKDDEGQRFDIA